MDRSAISHLAHGEHPIAAPLSDSSVADLLGKALAGRGSVLDLGCGSGTWLLRALQRHPGLTAVGVDRAADGFPGVLAQAATAGVADRLGLHRADVRTYTSPAPVDAVLSVGAAHAFGGLGPTLQAARRHLAPGGVVVLGECFWPTAPGARALEALGASTDDYTDLPGALELVDEHGWIPVHGHVSTQDEWDSYEWSWTGTLARWALEHPEHPDAAQALAAANEHRRRWIDGYRGALGFVTLVLRDGRGRVTGAS
jgi:cyclopropane fatty-acyl-phospholipid synthase-like methyltransferase